MVWKVRRVVTGHDRSGRSVFVEDRHAPNVKEMVSMPGLALTDLWETDGSPASNAGNADAARRPIVLEPPKNGTIVRIVEFPPDAQWRDRADARQAFDSIGAGHAPVRGSSDPMMHRTSTVDYIIVLSGEIYAIMDKGEKKLRAGDVLIQRGTNHSWSVRGRKPCIVAAVLVSAKPVATRAARAAAPRKKKTAAPRSRQPARA